MWKYILKRFLYFIPTLLGITVLVFTLVRLVPGDPVEIILGQHTTTELVELFEKRLGLDKPIYIQYFYWVRVLLTGNWGQSLISNQSVQYLIFHRFHWTLQLALLSMSINAILGVTIGVISAYKAGTRLDNVIRFLSIFGWAMPQFLIGIVLIYIFALKLDWFPAMGAGTVQHLILPAATLAFGGVSYLSRITRGSLLEVAGQDFVKTARAKGLPRRKILISHILRNGLLPVVTVLGLSFGWSLSGSFIVETIFSYPGIGFLSTTSVSRRDYPVVQGTVLFFAIIYCLSNLLVDILYVYLDPRVRYERRT